MANIWKWTVAFGFSKYGASETWYFQNDSSDAQAMINLVEPIVYARAKLGGKDCTLQSSRCQLVQSPIGTAIKRVGLQKDYLIPGTQTTGGNPNLCCDDNISLKIICKDWTRFGSKFVWMPAVWAGVVPTLNSYVGNFGGWLSFFNDWQNKMIAAKMGWLGQDKSVAGVQITNYVFDPDTGLTTFTLANPGITWPNNSLPARVRVSFPKKSWLDGVYLVTHTSATSCTTLDPMPAPPFINPGTMTLQKSTPYYLADPSGGSQVTGLIFAQEAASHKRGRPLYASRGRLPNHIAVW